jgi:hypothetical protein
VSLPIIELSEILQLPDGRTVEWESRGDGDALPWIEGGPGFLAHLARPDVDLIADRFRCYLVNARWKRENESSDRPVRILPQGAYRVLRCGARGIVPRPGHAHGSLVGRTRRDRLAALRPGNVARLVVIDGYAGDGSVAELSATAERERAFDRVRDRPWFEAALEAFDATNSRSMTEEELVRTFNRCLPLYFADPESEAAIAHIERLRREFRWNMEVSERWDAGEPADVVPLLPRVSCPTLVMVGELDFICGPVWNRPIAEGIPGADTWSSRVSGTSRSTKPRSGSVPSCSPGSNSPSSRAATAPITWAVGPSGVCRSPRMGSYR